MATTSRRELSPGHIFGMVDGPARLSLRPKLGLSLGHWCGAAGTAVPGPPSVLVEEGLGLLSRPTSWGAVMGNQKRHVSSIRG